MDAMFTSSTKVRSSCSKDSEHRSSITSAIDKIGERHEHGSQGFPGLFRSVHFRATSPRTGLQTGTWLRVRSGFPPAFKARDNILVNLNHGLGMNTRS